MKAPKLVTRKDIVSNTALDQFSVVTDQAANMPKRYGPKQVAGIGRNNFLALNQAEEYRHRGQGDGVQVSLWFFNNPQGVGIGSHAARPGPDQRADQQQNTETL